MNNLYRYFFWFCFSIFSIITAVLIVIVSIHGFSGIKYYTLKLRKIIPAQIRKLIYATITPEELTILHDHLIYRKEDLGQARINYELRKVIFSEPHKPIKRSITVKPGTVLEVGYGIVPDLSDKKYLGNVKFSIVIEHHNKKKSSYLKRLKTVNSVVKSETRKSVLMKRQVSFFK